ncbi:hypothetical protein hrd7_25020 [Leptolinea sp. HRD-7]|nr:hypothetical protein hrd7_25020 [Leptolinea sp. HRD-7]
MNENFGLKTSLHEVETSFLRTLDGISKTKATARSILSSASLIVALLSGLQIMTIKIHQDYIVLYQAGILVVFFLYFLLIVLCLLALRPVKTLSPIELKWETLSEAFVGKNEREVLEMQLSCYLNVIHKNAAICDGINRITIWAGWLLGLIVGILLLMSLLPKV